MLIKPRSVGLLTFRVFVSANERGLKSVPILIFVQGETQPVPAVFKLVVSQPDDELGKPTKAAAATSG
jgi:hypothetical protein